MNIIALITICVSLLIVTYFILIIITHDFTLDTLKIESLVNKDKKITDVLFIYPHPDDETMASGGLINKLCCNKNFKVQIVSITAGEKGDELVKVSPEKLREIRMAEFTNAMSCLQASKFEIWKFSDGNVTNQLTEIKKNLLNFVKANEIDLIITYERTGIYCHADHISLSKIVNEIQQETGIKTLFSTLPQNIHKMASLPDKIHYGDEIIALEKLVPEAPEFRLNIFENLSSKFKAANSYKSQNLSRSMPLWFKIFLMPFEYYTTKWSKQPK